MFSTDRALEVARELLTDDGLAGIYKVTIEIQVLQTLVHVYDANGENPVAIGSEKGLEHFYTSLTPVEDRI